MKKFLLLIPVICLLSFQTADAQFEKGKIMTGVTSTLGIGELGTDLMSVRIMSRKYNPGSGDGESTQKVFAFNLLPRAGYFVVDNLAVGIDLLFGAYSRKDEDGDKYTKTTVAIGPFARYYYPLENIYPFAEINFGFGSFSEKYSGNSGSDYKEGLLIFGLGVGASKPLGEKVMLDASLGYSSQRWQDNDDDDKYVYGGIGLRIGFTLFLDKPE